MSYGKTLMSLKLTAVVMILMYSIFGSNTDIHDKVELLETDSNGIYIQYSGVHAFSMYDLNGHRVFESVGTENGYISFSEIKNSSDVGNGLLMAVLEVDDARYTKRISIP